MNMGAAAENTARILGCPSPKCDQPILCSERCEKNEPPKCTCTQPHLRNWWWCAAHGEVTVEP